MWPRASSTRSNSSRTGSAAACSGFWCRRTGRSATRRPLPTRSSRPARPSSCGSIVPAAAEGRLPRPIQKPLGETIHPSFPGCPRGTVVDGPLVPGAAHPLGAQGRDVLEGEKPIAVADQGGAEGGARLADPVGGIAPERDQIGDEPGWDPVALLHLGRPHRLTALLPSADVEPLGLGARALEHV